MSTTITMIMTIMTTITSIDHRHDSRVRSYSLVHDGPVPFSAIEMFLDLLRSAHGDKLLRMKGVIELAEDPSRPLVVHGVQKILHPPARLPSWPDGQRGTQAGADHARHAGRLCPPAVCRLHQPAVDRHAGPRGAGKQSAGHRRAVEL